MAVQKPLLTNGKRSKHLLLAQQHEAWSAGDWSRVVFSDQCTFTTKWDHRAGVWRPDSTRFRPEFVQRVAASGRTVVSVWGCVTQDGLGPLVRIQAALTADEYSDIMDTVGLPHIAGRMTPQHDYFPAGPLAGSPCQKGEPPATAARSDCAHVAPTVT
ncbi:hypothetical protein MTO96_038772 [Rhipicephalus appendiculatus]